MNKILKNMRKYKDIEANHKTSIESLYNTSNKNLARLEQLIMYDCYLYNIPTERFKIYLNKIKKKNIQMAAKFKSLDCK